MSKGFSVAYFPSFISVNKLYYVLSGQHRFAAAMELKERMEKERVEVPEYCHKFRCNIIKPDTPLEVRQQIAGREQARQETVKRQSLSDTISWFLREVESAKAKAAQEGTQVSVSKKELLRTTYIKTGKNTSTDGTVV
jgi:hypothetical protein